MGINKLSATLLEMFPVTGVKSFVFLGLAFCGECVQRAMNCRFSRHEGFLSHKTSVGP